MLEQTDVDNNWNYNDSSVIYRVAQIHYPNVWINRNLDIYWYDHHSVQKYNCRVYSM